MSDIVDDLRRTATQMTYGEYSNLLTRATEEIIELRTEIQALRQFEPFIKRTRQAEARLAFIREIYDKWSQRVTEPFWGYKYDTEDFCMDCWLVITRAMEGEHG